MSHKPAVEFFARQFERQIAAGDFTLNPFERAALAHLQGEVLDLGCGLGNLALALAARGARVTAIDACETAVESLQARVARLGLPVEVSSADLSTWRPARRGDETLRDGHRGPSRLIGGSALWAPAHRRAVLREIIG